MNWPQLRHQPVNDDPGQTTANLRHQPGHTPDVFNSQIYGPQNQHTKEIMKRQQPKIQRVVQAKTTAATTDSLEHVRGGKKKKAPFLFLLQASAPVVKISAPKIYAQQTRRTKIFNKVEWPTARTENNQISVRSGAPKVPVKACLAPPKISTT